MLSTFNFFYTNEWLYYLQVYFFKLGQVGLDKFFFLLLINHLKIYFEINLIFLSCWSETNCDKKTKQEIYKRGETVHAFQVYMYTTAKSALQEKQNSIQRTSMNA